ncbi:MAG: hypothetical protein ACKESC_01025 [Candidatus Hodgkinia cicadicola]
MNTIKRCSTIDEMNNNNLTVQCYFKRSHSKIITHCQRTLPIQISKRISALLLYNELALTSDYVYLKIMNTHY